MACIRGLWVEEGEDWAPTGIHRTAAGGIRRSRCIPTTSPSTSSIRRLRTTSHYHSSICSSPRITNHYHSSSNSTSTTTFNRLITAMDTSHNYSLLLLTVSGRRQCNTSSTSSNQRDIGAP